MRPDSLRGPRRVRLLLVLPTVLLGCEAEAPVQTLPEGEDFRGADGIIMGGTTVITNREGIRSARLQFDTAFQWTDSIHQSLRGVDLMVFNEDGSERARVISLRGRFQPQEQSLTASGSVVLTVPSDDRTLETEELHYDPELEQLWSDSAFVMTERGTRYEGTAFTSDLEFQDFRVYGTSGR
jgi:LPS export ABC transporter protein LptC